MLTWVGESLLHIVASEGKRIHTYSVDHLIITGLRMHMEIPVANDARKPRLGP